MPKWPDSSTFLAGMALVVLGMLALLMVFFTVPSPNEKYLIFILGALSGALTVGGGKKVADSFNVEKPKE